MAGISDKAVKSNYAENKYRFQKQELQNKEFSDGSGLEMYEFKYRFDDPQIGRFGSIDPLAAKYEYNSPYAFSEDHVTGYIEFEGLEKFPINQDISFPGDPLSTIVRSAKDLQAVESQRAASRAVTGATTSTSPASTIGNVSNDGSQPVVGTTSTTKVTNETTSGSLIGLGTTTITNTTAVTTGTEGSIATLDVVHKQTSEGIEPEGVGGSLGPLTASYGFDGSFSIGASIKDEESGTDVHASIGVGAMNGNGVLSAGMASKGSGGVSTSVDASYTPGLSGIAVGGLFILSTFQPEFSIPLLKTLPNLAPAQ